MQRVRVRHPTSAPFYDPACFFNRLSVNDALAADQSPAANFYIQTQGGQPANWPAPGLSPYPYSLGFNFIRNSHPVYCVRPSDPSQNVVTQKVGLYYTMNGTTYQYGTPGTGGYALQQKFLNVPIPDKSKCPLITGQGDYVDIWSGAVAVGSDRGCFIWNLDTNEGFGFWQLYNGNPTLQALLNATWSAEWGEYIPDMTKFNGVFDGTQGGVNMSGLGWGERACGLGEVGGLITIQDVRTVFNGGTINHALAFACAWTGSGHVAPAVRDDAKGGASPVVEGTRLRFSPTVNPDSLTHPMTREMVRAMQTYGFVCMDSTAGAGGYGGIVFYIEDNRTVGSPYHMQGAAAQDPWTWDWQGKYGVNGPFQPTATTNVLTQMPWNQLQALTPVAS